MPPIPSIRALACEKEPPRVAVVPGSAHRIVRDPSRMDRLGEMRAELDLVRQTIALLKIQQCAVQITSR